MGLRVLVFVCCLRRMCAFFTLLALLTEWAETGEHTDLIADPKSWGMSTAAPIPSDPLGLGVVRRQVTENQQLWKKSQLTASLEEI